MYWVVKRFSSYLNIEAPPEQRWCHAQVTATQFATYEAAVFVRNAERSNPIVRDPKALRVVTVHTREDLRREREALRARVRVLEAAFQQTHGVHADWVGEATKLCARALELEGALEWFADEGHYHGTYRHGAGFAGAVGLTRARAALLGMDPDDEGLDAAWEKREAASKPAAPVPASKPVCSRCNDTHVVAVHEGCNDCPLACPKCTKKDIAYCQTTPCACACHRAGGTKATKATTKEEPQ